MHANQDIQPEERVFNCVVCDHERISVEPDGAGTCPNCRESYSLVVRDGFALVESDGWTTRVAFDAAGPSPSDAPH